MIPRRAFWIFDLLVLTWSFLAVYWLTPVLQQLFLPGNLLYSAQLGAFLSPPITGSHLPPMIELVWLLPVILLPTLLVLNALRNYEPLLYQSRTRVLLGSFVAPLVGVSIATLILFAVKSTDLSRLFVFTFAIVGGLSLALSRLALRQYFILRHSSGAYAKNVLLIGSYDAVAWMMRYFKEHVQTTDYRVIGCLHPEGVSASGRKQLPLQALGSANDLKDVLVIRPIHEVVAVQSMSQSDWIRDVIQSCDYFNVLLRIVPETLLFDEPRELKTLYPHEPLHLPAVILAPPHWDSEELFVKRIFDIFLASIALVLLSPVFLVIAVAIKLTTPKLSVFYPWRVVGQNGVEFTGYKFTTMIADADVRKTELLDQNEMSGPVFKMKDDPRVTPLGKFLRKYSLNELPQLYSVLNGDMSLVGPRPAFRHELERYEFWQKRKLCIRPGMTCLWQVSGRNRISDFNDWIKMDLDYIDNWSLWLDVRILIRTAWAVVAGTGW